MHVLRHATIATLQGDAGPRAAEAAGDVGLIEDGAIVVEDGRITYIGPDDECPESAGIDLRGRLVTPGFIDSHTHLVYAGDRAFELPLKLEGRSYMEILEAGGGIAHTTRATRAAGVDDLAEQAGTRLQTMQKRGTTTVEAKSGYALQTAGELRMLQAAARLEGQATMRHTFLGAHAVPEEYKDRTDAYVDLVIDEMLPAVAKQGIAHFCDVFVEEGVFTHEHGLAILEAAKKHDLRPRMHADEIVNTQGAQLAAKVGAVSADHLLAVSDEGIAAMAEAGTIATILPTVPVTMMQPQWAPAKRFLDAGVPVALASDHNPNNPVTDLGFVAQLGCYIQGLTPAQALTAITWNAACSLGLEAQVGSLEVGKQADLVVHRVKDLAHWVYEPGGATVESVLCSPA